MSMEQPSFFDQEVTQPLLDGLASSAARRALSTSFTALQREDDLGWSNRIRLAQFGALTALVCLLDDIVYNMASS